MTASKVMLADAWSACRLVQGGFLTVHNNLMQPVQICAPVALQPEER